MSQAQKKERTNESNILSWMAIHVSVYVARRENIKHTTEWKVNKGWEFILVLKTTTAAAEEVSLKISHCYSCTKVEIKRNLEHNKNKKVFLFGATSAWNNKNCRDFCEAHRGEKRETNQNQCLHRNIYWRRLLLSFLLLGVMIPFLAGFHFNLNEELESKKIINSVQRNEWWIVEHIFMGWFWIMCIINITVFVCFAIYIWCAKWS